ncbi:MAG: hypothetical protein GEU90_08715 [Gemmatimonas sp.]|nr:hypothetical protein [Gemmatimonas sp.]
MKATRQFAVCSRIASVGASLLLFLSPARPAASAPPSNEALVLQDHAPGTVGPTLTSPASADTLDFAYFRDRIEPILVRERGGFGPSVSACVTCHVRSATPMPLQPLNVAPDGSVFWTVEQSRQNFEVMGRLVAPGEPERSRLLRAPLAPGAGGTHYHAGGKFWESTDDPEWRIIADWVRQIAPAEPTAATPTLQFEFFRDCVQRIFLDQRAGRTACVNCHNGGVRNFAPSIPDGRPYWNEGESRRNFDVAARYIEPGHPLLSRFLTRPLHPDAGGDRFHAGGRRWDSQADPEWQMLASWVRGEAPKCVLEE